MIPSCCTTSANHPIRRAAWHLAASTMLLRVLAAWWTLEETLPIRMVDRWTGRSSCSLRIAGTFWWPCASGHGDRHLLCLWIQSIFDSWWLLKWTPVFPFWSVAPPGDDSMQTDWWRDADPLSSLAPGTAGCRTWEMLCSEPSLWLPWTAGHPRPAGDPGSCSWCGMRCYDGWVEVHVGNLDPPLSRLCWWPNRTPEDFATDGQSLPGKPPPVSRQRQPAAGAWVAPEDLRRWDTLGRPRLPRPDSARKDCVSWVMVLGMVGWLVVKHRGPGLLCLDLWRLLGDLGCGSFFSQLLECDWRSWHPVCMSDVTYTLL